MAWQRMWWNNWNTWDNEILSEHQGLFQSFNTPYRFNFFFPFQHDFTYFVRYSALNGEWKVERKYGAWLFESIRYRRNKSSIVRTIQNSFGITIFCSYNCHAHRMLVSHTHKPSCLSKMKNEKKRKRERNRRKRENDWHLKCVFQVSNIKQTRKMYKSQHKTLECLY